MSLGIDGSDDADWSPYWEGCLEHRLVVQACDSCGTRRWPPRPICSHCRSFDVRWEQVPSAARVFSWTVVTRAGAPGFTLPYTVVLGAYTVVLGELVAEPSVRVLANLLHDGEPGRSLYLGAELSMVFRADASERVRPQWRLTTD